MMDIHVTPVIETYQRCLNSKPHFPSTTFGRATLGASGVTNKLFLAFLFSNPDVGVQFLKDVGLIRSSMVCCECWSAYRNLEMHGYTQQTVNHTICFHDAHTGAHMNTTESTFQHVKAFLNSYNRMGTTSITWPTTCLRRRADPTTWTSSSSSSASL